MALAEAVSQSDASIRDDLAAEWGAHWPGCADPDAMAELLFFDGEGLEHRERARGTCAATDQKLARLVAYAGYRARSSRFASHHQAGAYDAVEGPDLNLDAGAFTAELARAQAESTDPWLRQRYAFLQLRVLFYRDRANANAFFERERLSLRAPSQIIWSLSRRYHVGALVAAGRPQEAERELTWLRDEGSLVSALRGNSIDCTLDTIERRFAREPGSALLLACALNALRRERGGDWKYEGDRKIESVVRRAAEKSKARAASSLWLLSATLAAERGDVKTSDVALAKVRTGDLGPERRSSLREVRAMARAAALAKSLDFAGYRAEAEPDALYLFLAQAGFERAQRAALVDPARGTSGEVKALERRRDTDPAFAWYLQRTGQTRELAQAHLFRKLLAEGRPNELPHTVEWGALGRGDDQPRVHFKNHNSLSWESQAACLPEEGPAVCLRRLENTRRAGPPAGSEQAAVAELGVLAQLGCLDRFNDRFRCIGATDVRAAALNIVESLSRTTKDRELKARAAFLGAHLTLSPVEGRVGQFALFQVQSSPWYQRLRETRGSAYEREALASCTFYRLWASKRK